MNNMFLPGFLILDEVIKPKESVTWGGGSEDDGDSISAMINDQNVIAYYFAEGNEMGLPEGWYTEDNLQWVRVDITVGNWEPYTQP